MSAARSADPADTDDAPVGGRAKVHLLGRFSLEINGEEVELAPAGQRIFAMVALLDGSASRSRVAGMLWPDQSESRSLSNLRSVLWRLPALARAQLRRSSMVFVATPRPVVDVDVARTCARHLLGDRSGAVCDASVRDLLTLDLLPEWDDPWLVIERERHRQFRLHALEAVASRQLRANAPLDCVDTMMAAVASEPLRESAQILLVAGHLASGNYAEAVAQFERFERDLADSLGVAPSAELVALIRSSRGRHSDAAVTRQPEG